MSINSKIIDKVPEGPIGIIATESCKEFGKMIDEKLVQRRVELENECQEMVSFPSYIQKSYLKSVTFNRFSSGEGKVVLDETVRGHDIYIITDIGNYSLTYKMFGIETNMSPDDHFQDLKRIIGAISGKARRINLIMPLLYEGRQHKRTSRESLDCAIALQELNDLGVENIITFDAHDPRVQNSIPTTGFENLYAHYQFIKALLRKEKDLEISKDKMFVISPDEGGLGRSVYYANMLGLNLGMFYKRRDYTRVVNGRNPIIKHEFLGDNVEGMDILIVDDLISSGDSLIDIITELKERKANRIYIAVTFALFADGLEVFNHMYEKGMFTRIYSTNLTYRRPELLNAPWYSDIDVSKFISYIIDALNCNQSISTLINPTDKIRKILNKEM
jgi:ribose-phosphate pyrophosphokinase